MGLALDFGQVILSTSRALWLALRSRRQPHDDKGNWALHVNAVEEGRLRVNSSRCFVEALHTGRALRLCLGDGALRHN